LVSNGFWHIVSVVKEQDLPVMQKGYIQLEEYLSRCEDCQHQITDFHSHAQIAGKSLRGGRIRVSRRKPAQEISMDQKTQNAKKAISQRSLILSRGVFSALQRLGVWRAGAKFGVAVSGGADSVALLLLFLELREAAHTKGPMEIAVVHFNHQLRGAAADADEEFVRQLAAKRGLEFHRAAADVRETAKRAKRNMEDAGRRERYGFFARLVEQGSVDWVATAHTMDDQAETVLAHLLRGTGLAGLGGIHPISGGIVRPILHVRRAELRRYLKQCKQTWREDATNRDTSKTRARIRAKLIPLLEKQYQAEVVAHLATLAEQAREDEEFLDAAAASKLASTLDESHDTLRIRVDLLTGRATPRALRGRIVRKIVKACKGRDGELGAQHVAGVLQLAECGENGKSLELPGGVEVRREKNALSFHSAPETQSGATAGDKSEARGKASAAIAYAHEVLLNTGEATVSVPLLRCVFRFRAIDWLGERSETRSTAVALDSAKLRKPLVLRNWRPGDRLQPVGHSGVYKLKRLLNKKGISRWDRNGWPVLTSGDVIVWVRGFPVAAEFAADEKTHSGLVIDEEPL
jgi:tRNA(Ile)-lysidine synthase